MEWFARGCLSVVKTNKTHQNTVSKPNPQGIPTWFPCERSCFLLWFRSIQSLFKRNSPINLTSLPGKAGFYLKHKKTSWIKAVPIFLESELQTPPKFHAQPMSCWRRFGLLDLPAAPRDFSICPRISSKSSRALCISTAKPHSNYQTRCKKSRKNVMVDCWKK